MYSTLFCGKRGEKTLTLEIDKGAFGRATHINQARIHMGYHYPRSYSTAIKSANYFERFAQDYSFSIQHSFSQIYATSTNFSWTSGRQFEKFCCNTGIPYEKVAPEKFFKDGLCDAAFLTKEYTYDAQILKEYFLDEIAKYPCVEIQYSVRIESIVSRNGKYIATLGNGLSACAPFVLNATYASLNQVIDLLRFEKFKIKYELCEMILCTVNEKLKDVGITVMDGPFFSIMPFGKTSYHSLTSVTFTPHFASCDPLPTFPCQFRSYDFCGPKRLGNCNDCPTKPKSAWDYMNSLAKKYLKEEYQFSYADSLYSMKPVLSASEIDDSRPTVIKKHSENPTFVSVLSGKINTVYDLDEVLSNET